MSNKENPGRAIAQAIGFLILACGGTFLLFIALVWLEIRPRSAFSLAMSAASLASSWGLLRFCHAQGLAAIGIGLDRPWVTHLLGGCLIGIVQFLGVLALCIATGRASVDVSNAPAARIIAAGLVTRLVRAFPEELICRGYLLQVVARWNRTVAIALTALVFVLPHMFGMQVHPIAAINLALFHLLAVAAYLRTRSLWFPLGIHIGWNFTEGDGFGMPVSGKLVSESIFTTRTTHSIWSGDDFGLEGGLLGTGFLFLSTILIWKTLKQSRPTEDLLGHVRAVR